MPSSKPVITPIDCDYLHPRFAAAYLIREGAAAAFVDNNTARSVPKLLAALQREGLTPEQVRYVIITHVHLDHAGGSSALMKACPNATLLAHPRAVPHVVDPSKLVESARRVYGDAEFERLYGLIEPVAAERVREMPDGAELELGAKRRLRFVHTRGHANHHFVVVDPAADGVFTGDAFGLAYPALQAGGLFVFPSTSPTDFDPAEARLSIQRILDTKVGRVWPTHFGEVRNLPAVAAQLRAWIDLSEDTLNDATSSSEPDEGLPAFCESMLRPRFQQELERRGLAGDAGIWALIRLDLELNAAGIAHVAKKRRQKRQQGSKT